MLGDGADEEVPGRIDHVFRLDQAQSVEGLLMDAPVRQRLGISQSQIGAVKSGLLFVL